MVCIIIFQNISLIVQELSLRFFQVNRTFNVILQTHIETE